MQLILLVLIALLTVRSQYCPTTLYQVYAGSALGATSNFCPLVTFTTNGLLITTTGNPIHDINPSVQDAVFRDMVMMCNYHYVTATPTTRLTFSYSSMTRRTTDILPGTWTRTETWIGGLFAGDEAGETPLFAYFPWRITEQLAAGPVSTVENSFAVGCVRPAVVTETVVVSTTLPVDTILSVETDTSGLTTVTTTSTTTLPITLSNQTRTSTIYTVVTTFSSTVVFTVTVSSTINTSTGTTRTRLSTVTLSVTSTSTVSTTTTTSTVTILSTSFLSSGLTLSTTTTTTDTFCSDRVPI